MEPVARDCVSLERVIFRAVLRSGRHRTVPGIATPSLLAANPLRQPMTTGQVYTLIGVDIASTFLGISVQPSSR